MAEKIQWHPGFYAGMELELKAFDLSFDSEHQVTRGPLSIDLLIIKNLSDQKITVDFADCFRRHNIVEFKSPEDELSILRIGHCSDEFERRIQKCARH